MHKNFWQFIKFCTVGGIGLLINLGITHGLVVWAQVWYLWAFVLALLFSWSLTFVLNAFFTFPEHERSAYLKKYFLFLASYGLVFCINTAIVYVGTSILGLHYLISICISALITTLLTFSISKHVIYHSEG